MEQSDLSKNPVENYMIIDELKLIDIEEKIMPPKLRRLEESFRKFSDIVHDFLFAIREGGLRTMTYDELVETKNNLIQSEKTLYDRYEEYFGFGDSCSVEHFHPNYEKFSEHLVVVFKEFDSEIRLRQWYIGGCSLN